MRQMAPLEAQTPMSAVGNSMATMPSRAEGTASARRVSLRRLKSISTPTAKRGTATPISALAVQTHLMTGVVVSDEEAAPLVVVVIEDIPPPFATQWVNCGTMPITRAITTMIPAMTLTSSPLVRTVTSVSEADSTARPPALMLVPAWRRRPQARRRRPAQPGPSAAEHAGPSRNGLHGGVR